MRRRGIGGWLVGAAVAGAALACAWGTPGADAVDPCGTPEDATPCDTCLADTCGAVCRTCLEDETCAGCTNAEVPDPACFHNPALDALVACVAQCDQACRDAETPVDQPEPREGKGKRGGKGDKGEKGGGGKGGKRKAGG